MGVSRRPRRACSELERTTTRTPCRRARAFLGCTRGFASARPCGTTGRSVVGSSRRTGTFVGRAGGPDWASSHPARSARAVVGSAACGRAVQACRPAGHIVESAGSRMGPTEARHARSTVSARLGRLGPACHATCAAPDRGAILGRARRSRLGCAED